MNGGCVDASRVLARSYLTPLGIERGRVDFFFYSQHRSHEALFDTKMSVDGLGLTRQGVFGVIILYLVCGVP